MKVRIGVTLLLGVAVFCFWGYMRPGMIVARESMQLFLWNGDYLADRLTEPGGAARYIGEFLGQFFKYITYGAWINALVLMAVQWLAWLLLRRLWQSWVAYGVSFVPAMLLWYLMCDISVPMTLPVAVLLLLAVMALMPASRTASLWLSVVLVPVVYWLAGPVAILLPLYHLRWLGERKGRTVVETAVLSLLLLGSLLASSRMVHYPLRMVASGIDYRLRLPDKIGSLEEMEYDYLQRLGSWDAIVERSEARAPESLSCQHVVRLAKWYRKEIGEEDMKEIVSHTNRVLTSYVSALMMSDVYMHLGMVSMAQRADFEVLEASTNYNKSGRALARQVETCLVREQYEVALKYISLLEQTIFYRDFAQRMRRLAEHPELIERDPYYGPLKKVAEQTVDGFFI